MLMNRFFCVLVALVVSVGFAGVMAQPAQDWANFERYQLDNQVVKALPQDKRSVVFMGNSITENWVRRHKEFFEQNGSAPLTSCLKFRP